MVDAPYGMCEKHDVPLELLFQTPFCPMCEDAKEKAKGEECCKDKGDCDGPCADDSSCDDDSCGTCGGGCGYVPRIFPWA